MNEKTFQIVGMDLEGEHLTLIGDNGMDVLLSVPAQTYLQEILDEILKQKELKITLRERE